MKVALGQDTTNTRKVIWKRSHQERENMPDIKKVTSGENTTDLKVTWKK